MTEIDSHPLEPDREQPRRSLASPQIYKRILNWLMGLVQISDKEQKDAGIDLGYQRYK